MNVPPPKLLILAAFCMESDAMAQALNWPRHPSLPHAYAEPDRMLVTIGLGASRLPKLREALRAFKPDQVLLAGLGGALSPDMRAGDVVYDGHSPIPHAKNVRIVQAAEVLATPEAKAAMFQSTHAPVVDMECDTVRAAFHPLPVTVIRAVSDDAHTAIDPAVLALVDDLGRPRPAKVALLLARRPLIISQLKRLQRDSDSALAGLAKSVAAYVASFQSPATPEGN